MTERPMSQLTDVLDTLDTQFDASVERLFTLLRCQSISTDPAFAAECQKAAEMLSEDLESIGFDSRVAPTPGHPMVVAHHDGPGPHVLFYGHYDVQPVDPIELWHSDPFDPQIVTREDGSKIMVGRGTGDDKGQLMTFIEACRALKSVTGALPCKVTILLEGEEESGGKNLPPFLNEHADELKADIAIVCDTCMWDRETPAITTMLRGMLGQEITVHAASRDLHSGFYGGAAANPIHILSRALAGLHDETGRVTIPGFYDGVPEIPADVQAQWDALDFTNKGFLGEVGLSIPAGEEGYNAMSHTWARPTAEVNGVWGGYTGTGFKTVIPAEAHAKISFRLVGDQDPLKIREAFKKQIRAAIPADCRVEIIDHGASGATVMPLTDPAFETARQALSDEWGKEAAFIGCGGSIPVVGELKRQLGMDTLLIGFGQDDDAIHSPNEKYEMTSFAKGARSFARVLTALGEKG
ncbi:M20/M25/M40 family metallo-hydrolase [Rhodobacteraceae bacterium NNCM2]|nr:M20/M25/M40 family metallo-hydrolase [Coraliihabitans acroporae]